MIEKPRFTPPKTPEELGRIARITPETPLDTCELDVRVLEFCEKNGMRTVGDLTAKSAYQLQEMGIGKRTLLRVQKCLAGIDRKLREDE